MTAVLLANASATLFMVGLSWFVQVVHYPLFAAVGADRFPAYHREHSRRTTWVVAAPMLAELVSSFALLVEPPAGETALTALGAVLAAAVWVLTFVAAVPAHRGLGDGFRHSAQDRLVRANLVRTLVWTAHGAVVIALLAAEL